MLTLRGIASSHYSIWGFDWHNPRNLGQYHNYWHNGDAISQGISSHVIGYVGYRDYCLAGVGKFCAIGQWNGQWPRRNVNGHIEMYFATLSSTHKDWKLKTSIPEQNILQTIFSNVLFYLFRCQPATSHYLKQWRQSSESLGQNELIMYRLNWFGMSKMGTSTQFFIAKHMPLLSH